MTSVANTVENVTKLAKPSRKPKLAVVATPDAPAVTILERDRIYRVDPLSLNIEVGYNVEGRAFNSATKPQDAELLKSIQHGGGIKTPLTVRQDEAGSLFIIAGHRRLGAALELIAAGKGRDVETVPVMIANLKNVNDRSHRDADLFTSNSGEKLSAIQQALVAQRMVGNGYKLDAIANIGGFSTKYVKILLGAANLPNELQEHMIAGRVPLNTVTEMVAKYDADDKVNAPITRGIIAAAIQAKSKRVGFGSDLTLKGKDIVPHLPLAVVVPVETATDAAPVVEPAATEVTTPVETATDAAPVVETATDAATDAAPISTTLATFSEMDNKTSKLSVSGARVLKAGKILCTFTGATPELARENALKSLPALMAIEHLFG